MRLWCWEGLGAEGEGDDWGWDGWMASETQWTWVWVISVRWWWTGRPGVLRFMGLQIFGHDWVTEPNWKPWKLKIMFYSSLHVLSHVCNRPGIQMYEEEVGWMNEWVFLYRVVRVKMCPLSRVVPKGNGDWGMPVQQEESNYTSPGGEEDESVQTCSFLPLRISTPFFFFFFPFPSISELVCKPFSFRSC